jgi:hypothetical protein
LAWRAIGVEGAGAPVERNGKGDRRSARIHDDGSARGGVNDRLRSLDLGSPRSGSLGFGFGHSDEQPAHDDDRDDRCQG